MADSTLAALTEITSLAGTELVYVDNGSADRKAKLSTVKTYIGGWVTLKQVNVEQTVVTGTTSKTTSYSVTIPGGTIGANGRLKVTVLFTFTGANGTRTVGVDYGGSTLWQPAASASSVMSIEAAPIIKNRSTSSQIGSVPLPGATGAGTSAAPTASIDSTAAQTLSIWVQLQNGADSGAVESVMIEVNNDNP